MRRTPPLPQRRGALLGGALAVLALTAPGRGQPQGFPLDLRYEAGGACPTRQELERELAARDLRYRAPAAGEPATTLRLTIEPDGERVRGSLEVRLLTGERTVRELRGASCADVVRSLTLVAALALSPIASPAPAASSSAAPPASSPPPLASSPAAPASSAPAPAAPAAERAIWSAGFGGGVTSAVGPELLPGLLLWLERSEPGLPSARLTAAYWPHGATKVETREAVFGAYMMQLDGCWPLRRGAAWVSPCGGLQGGVLVARGRGIDMPRSTRRPWLAPGLGPRLGWSSGKARIEVDVAVFFPIFRDSFVFDVPRIEVYRPPAAGWRAGLGAGVDF